ncbi:ABC transporter permease [Kaistia adipata]|uniref:ABC transporter permease n=1 Tax=Kaistia adipata TaxID=166954 RepID=UPI000429A90E|nr:ABC transporter permease [Kaistia adipata]
MNEATRVRTPVLLLCLLPGVGYLTVFFGVPLVRVLVGSFSSNKPGESFPTLDTWATLFATPVYLDGLWFSIWLGLAPTVLSLLVSLPLSALMLANERSRKLFGALYRVPLVVPGIVAGFLVLVILDRGGMAARLAAPLGLTLPRLVRDEWGLGAIIASSWKSIPFMTLIISGAMASINKEVLSAARTLGAGRVTIFWRVQMPLAKPGITAAVLLSFIGSLGSFVIPSLLGPAYPLPLSVSMYREGFQNGNWPMVYAMGTLLSVVAIGILLVYYAIVGSTGRSQPLSKRDS